jgi:hypothetical protein
MGFYPHRALRLRLSALYSDFNIQIPGDIREEGGTKRLSHLLSKPTEIARNHDHLSKRHATPS